MSELKPCPCGKPSTTFVGDVPICPDCYREKLLIVTLEQYDSQLRPLKNEVVKRAIELIENLIEQRNTRPSRKAQIADALTDMRRRGYFDGGLMVQLIAKEMDAGLEDVQKFLNALINVCEGGGE
jgi:histidinol phosphatase-like enzyme